MHISELLDETELKREIDTKRISVRMHPSLPLKVYNYTAAAQYGGHSSTTLACRGLITNDAGEIVGRPLPKFFNYNESAAPKYTLDDKVVATDKADGSLIIAFHYAGQFVCATRGSFASEQAISAQQILNSVTFPWKHNLTYLFEYVGPDNRIVLEYPESTLLSLGAVNTQTGDYTLPGDVDTPFESVARFPYETFGEVLSAAPRDNAEGLVVFGDKGLVKVKQDDYVELHRLVTGLNEKAVWEALCEGRITALTEKMPEEFEEWIEGVVKGILDEAASKYTEIYAAYHDLSQTIPSRKDFALRVNAKYKHLSRYMFALLDGKDIWPMILRECKPEKETNFVSDEEV